MRRWCRIAPMNPLLDNIMWNCLSGPHARFATRRRRRAALCARLLADRRLPRIPEQPDFADARALLRRRRKLLCRHLVGRGAGGLAHREGSHDVQDGLGRARARGGCRAGRHSACGRNMPRRRVELAQLTNPGPSASARPSSANISATSRAAGSSPWRANACARATCTRSAASARIRIFRAGGSRSKLTLKLVRRQMQRGKTPFLHVMSHNTPARGAVREDGVPELP